MANCKGLKGAKLKACQAKVSALVKKATEGSSITELENASTFRNRNASVIERKMASQKKGIKSMEQMALNILAAEKRKNK